jgi:GT2 family glycosyltransferase
MKTQSSERASASHSLSYPVKISVVTTLLYPRERPLECLRSWTHGQDFPPDDIEMIVVINGRRRHWENRLPEVLRPGDRTLYCNDSNEMALYDAGIRAARGEWILMTEPHVTAEPDCIRQLLDHSQAEELAGACARTMPCDERSPVARMEARMYLESAAAWSRPGEWRLITKRGVMFRKDAYLSVGGFDTDQLRFAETTLAAKLHQAGYPLGYAEAARIHHQNSTSLGELLHYIWEYRRQELRVLCEQPGLLGEDTCSSAFAGDPGLSGLTRALPGARRALLQAIWGVVAGLHAMEVWRLRWLLLRACLRVAIPASPVRIAPPLAAFYRFVRAGCAFYLAGKDDRRRYAAYQKLWQTLGDLSVATLPLKTVKTGGAATAAARTPSTRQVCMARLRPGEAAGFHGLENLGNRSFRWTSPIAVVRIPESEGKIKQLESVTWEILQARPLGPKAVCLFHGGRQFQGEEMPDGNGWLFKPQTPLDGSARKGAEYLVLICPPWVVPGSVDRRLLGLPVVGVSWQFGRSPPIAMPHIEPVI